MTQKQTFTEGKIFIPLVKFMLPLFGVLFLQALYGAGDMFIIGLYGSTSDVSAVATGSGIIDIVRAIVGSLAIGVTVVIAQQVGANDLSKAGKAMGSGLWLFSILGVGLTLFLFLPAELWVRLMQAPPEAFNKTILYVRICASGSLFISLYNILSGILRGLGDSKTPLIIVFSTFILNFLGDIYLVGHLKMGAGGSALTNVLAQALSVLIAILIIKYRHLPFRFSLKMIRRKADYMNEILRIGFPIVLQDILVSISFLVVNAIVNSLGLIPSAGVGVAERCCGFIMLVPMAFEQALSAFAAQNIGAGRPDRARKALFYCVSSSLLIGVVMAWFAYFHGDIMASFFAKDKPEVILAAADYLRAYAIDCLSVCFLFCFNGYFSGLGFTKYVMINGITGAFGVRIPVSWLMSHIQPVSLFRVGLATPCSTILQICMCLYYYRKINQNQNSKQKACS